MHPGIKFLSASRQLDMLFSFSYTANKNGASRLVPICLRRISRDDGVYAFGKQKIDILAGSSIDLNQGSQQNQGGDSILDRYFPVCAEDHFQYQG